MKLLLKRGLTCSVAKLDGPISMGQARWAKVIEELLQRVYTIVDIAGYTHIENDTPSAILSKNQVIVKGIDCRGHVMLDGVEGFADEESEHLLVISSWLLMKELGLTLRSLVEALPLPSVAAVLSGAQIGRAAHCLLRVLRQSKHNGIIDKTHMALLGVCERLLHANDPASHALVSEWLDEYLRR
eukprot:259264_1